MNSKQTTTKLIPLSLVMILLPLIHFGQITYQDSLSCFTPTEVRKIITDLKQGDICDSISKVRDIQIHAFNKQIIKDTKTITDLTASNNSRQTDITICANKLYKARRQAKNNILMGSVGGLLLGVLVNGVLNK